LDRAHGGIADLLSIVPQDVFRAGAQKLEIVFENVLDSQKDILESRLAHQRRNRLTMISNRRRHSLDDVLDIVQAGSNDGFAQLFEAVDVERDVVIDEKD